MGKGINCICIDDKNRPKEIPQELWIKFGTNYTITHVFKQINQNNIKGVELAEIDISNCKPYNSFRLSRFAIDVKDLFKFGEMLNDCTELNKLDVNDFVRTLLEKGDLVTHE